jgi:hypothetical protein
MANPDDDDIDLIVPTIPMPLQTLVAGVTWMVAGIIGLLLSPIWLFIAIILVGVSDVPFIAVVVGGFVVAFLAVWLISIGKRTLRGQCIDLLRTGKASMILGTGLIAGNVCMMAIDASILRAFHKQIAAILKGMGINVGIVLILVGVIAILGREQDQVWRNWKSGRM